MKAKRNKRVQQKRAARLSPPRHTFLARVQNMLVPRNARSRSRKVLALLEEDARIQTERLQQFEAALSRGWSQPQPELVPVAEAPAPMQQPEVTALADGRTNYQHLAASKRVRRRIML